MSRSELIIQLLKIIIGLAFGAYFLWWSVEVFTDWKQRYLFH
jgi:hypothetical protein